MCAVLSPPDRPGKVNPPEGPSEAASGALAASDRQLKGLVAGRETIAARKQLREQIAGKQKREGYAKVATLVLGPRPEHAEKMYVRHLLTAIRAVGTRKTRMLLRKSKIDWDARMHELTDRQRADLAHRLLKAAKTG